MSDCGDSLRSLYEYVDGELTEQRRALIRRHLDDCSPCLGAFEFEMELRVVISERCREQVPDHLRDRIARAIEELGPAD